MKIPLNMGQNNGQMPSIATENRGMERDIHAASSGDWNAKHNLERTFLPLMTALAEKRTSDVAQINRYLDAGKEGLAKAVKKYNAKVGAEKFRIFALNFIEKAMDDLDAGGGSFWARLFKR